MVRRRGLALNALDRWTVGYAAVASAITLVRWPSPAGSPAPVLAVHAVLAAMALLAPRVRRRGRLGLFIGAFYPLFAVLALYTSIGLVNAAAGVSHDVTVQAWEQALFHGQPSRDWIRARPWPWLSALLHGGYLSYYLILVAAPLGPWVSGRRAAAGRIVLVVVVTFYACYLAFLLFPVAGPRYAFPPARNAATAVAPAVFTQRLLDGAAAWGTAFPSSHVAAAVAAAVTAWQEWRTLGGVLLPLAALLSVGTVYGQLHYAVDALGGVAVAALVLALHRPRRPD